MQAKFLIPPIGHRANSTSQGLVSRNWTGQLQLGLFGVNTGNTVRFFFPLLDNKDLIDVSLVTRIYQVFYENLSPLHLQ